MEKRKKMRRKERVVLKFLLLLFISGLLGGVVGVFFTDQEKMILSTATGIQQVVADTSVYVMIFLGIFGCGYNLLVYRDSRQKFMRWDQEDEDFIEKVENQIEKGMVTTEIVQIVSFVLLGFFFLNLKGNNSVWETIIGCVVFLALSIGLVFQQRAYVKLTQKINPEKKGDALDLHFQKKWLDSCDELEKMQIYESSYYSFQMMQRCFPIAIGIMMFTEVYFDAGVMPVMTVGILWLIQTVTYKNYAMRLTKRKGKQND